MPKRIQRKKNKGWKMPSNTVYVGRPTKFANPFIIDKIMPPFFMELIDNQDYYIYSKTFLTSNDSVYLFEKYCLLEMSEFVDYLKGKNLACWCPLNKPCHADVLLNLANN